MKTSSVVLDVLKLSEADMDHQLKLLEKSGERPNSNYLLRSVQLQSEKLYKKTLSLGGTFYEAEKTRYGFSTTCLDKISKIDPEGKWFLWGLDTDHRRFIDILCVPDSSILVSQLNIPWVKVAKHPKISEKIYSLLLSFFVQTSDTKAHEAILERASGELGFPSKFSVGFILRSDSDEKIAERINRLPLGSITSVDFPSLFSLGLLRSSVAALTHVEIMEPLEKIKLPRNFLWKDIGDFLASNRHSPVKKKNEIFSFLCKKVNLTTIDCQKNTALSLLNFFNDDQAVLMCEEIMSQKPQLAFQKNQANQSALEYTKPLLRAVIKSHTDKINLEKMIKYQSKVGKKNKTAPAKSSSPPQRRSM